MKDAPMKPQVYKDPRPKEYFDQFHARVRAGEPEGKIYEVVRALENGRMSLPSDPGKRAIYESRMAAYEQRQQKKEQAVDADMKMDAQGDEQAGHEESASRNVQARAAFGHEYSDANTCGASGWRAGPTRRALSAVVAGAGALTQDLTRFFTLLEGSECESSLKSHASA